MQKEFQTLEFDQILTKLENYAFTNKAKEVCRNLKPYLNEVEVHNKLKETTQARKILDNIGTPPIISMRDMEKLLITVGQGGMLLPTQLEYIGITLTGIKRIKDFLDRCKYLEVGIAYYSEELDSLDDLKEEIIKDIRNGSVDDYASKELREIRRSMEQLRNNIKDKADNMLRNHKEYYSDSFVSNRNGHICLPVKKEYKFKMDGSVIDKSATGNTLFIEPTAIAKMNEELQIGKIDEENEERKILYTLSSLVADCTEVIYRNMDVIAKIDFHFAKGKLSAEMDGCNPIINTQHYISIKEGRHPLLDKEECVPLNFEIGKGINGIVITGPNTGGKTVVIKTVGLLSIMAQCGLHIPCKEAKICMNSQILCDIGDGQNISENLSTFSAHITNILDIMKKVNEESLVLLDELGSGTDPTEGMGIAIAILGELRKNNCLFIATTHYPEVKTYAEKTEGVINARMAFDRESLKPLYQLELGKAGESCALHIAKRLGMPSSILKVAYKEAYKDQEAHEKINKDVWQVEDSIDLNIDNQEKVLQKNNTPHIIKRKVEKPSSKTAEKYQMGDSVMVYPDRKIGIVCKMANEKGEIVVQLKNKKVTVNHKRLKLQVAAHQLYPEDYDFSIVFDTVENRKARHKMNKGHQPDLEIKVEE